MMKQAAIRAARTFVQSFLGVYLSFLIIGEATLSSFVDPAILDVAAAAGIIATLSFVQNALEDTGKVRVVGGQKG